jgi:hypothetical protein
VITLSNMHGAVTRNVLRTADLSSINTFVSMHKKFLVGDVLDFGAGLQPYRHLVTGNYVPYTPEHPSTPAGSLATASFACIKRSYDAILCTQVVQYLEHPSTWFKLFASMLWACEGYLIMTYPAADDF